VGVAFGPNGFELSQPAPAIPWSRMALATETEIRRGERAWTPAAGRPGAVEALAIIGSLGMRRMRSKFQPNDRTSSPIEDGSGETANSSECPTHVTPVAATSA